MENVEDRVKDESLGFVQLELDPAVGVWKLPAPGRLGSAAMVQGTSALG